MAETLGQMLNYINENLSNNINSTTIITFINNELRKMWKVSTKDNLYEFDTVIDVPIYSLPSDCEFSMIQENGVMIHLTTDAITSTSAWETCSYCGDDEELNYYNFYDAFDGLIGLYPVPEKTGYKVKIKYQERPTLFASTDTNIQFNINEDYIDYVRFKVMARVAKSGNNPDVLLANNYEADANEIEKKLMMDYQKEKLKTTRGRWGYKDGWV